MATPRILIALGIAVLLLTLIISLVAVATSTLHARPRGRWPQFGTTPYVVGLLAGMVIFTSVASMASVARVGHPGPPSHQSASPSHQSAPPAAYYTNPVIASDFADPDVLVLGAQFYAYATGSAGEHIQVATSGDLAHWRMLPDALPTLPSWVSRQNSLVWAPAVIAVGGSFVLYYTAHDAATDRQCIGVAISASPAGPFFDSRQRPLVCQSNLGGDIDPSPLRVGDALYLYFKNDGNCCRLPTHLWAQPLSADGLSLRGQPTPLLVNDRPWEGAVIEAPDMFVWQGVYYMFYSANNYASASYAVGYARCQSPLGPCAKSDQNPILHSQPSARHQVIGPGGESVFTVGGASWIAYHAWNTPNTQAPGAARTMSIDRLDWVDGEPVVQGPSTTAQPLG